MGRDLKSPIASRGFATVAAGALLVGVVAAWIDWPIAAPQGLQGVARAQGQPQDQPVEGKPAPAVADSECLRCHSCPAPTKERPCLRACTRDASSGQAVSPGDGIGPAVVILNELEDRYLPVPFDHKGHAEMARMTRGCVVCHHYTPGGSEHPACKTCHEINPVREDIRKPGLKGAYHRQCLNCHREWSHDTKCGICHQPKAGTGAHTLPIQPAKDDIVGRMHPPIPEPDTEIYSTTSQLAPGRRIIFRHKEHIHRFGLRCVECHHEDSCSRCHDATPREAPVTRTFEQHHQPCFRCHVEDACAKCHWEPGQPPPAPFDHVQTSWPLNRYHEDLSCRACHSEVPFARRDPRCDACHRAWTPGGFDHAVTGQALNALHANFACEECHAGRAFDKPPTCDSCHDEDEGIAYPQKRPGPLAPARANKSAE